MAVIRSTPAFFEQLKRLIPDLPPKAIAIDIRMRPDELVTVTCVFAAATGDEPTTKTFHLVEDEAADSRAGTAQAAAGPST